MSDSPERTAQEKQLELFLDGQLSPEARIEFEKRLAENSTLAEVLDAERQLCDNLRGAFVPPDKSIEQLELLLSKDCLTSDSSHRSQVVKNRRRRMIAVIAAVAASIAFALFTFLHQPSNKIEPFFRQRPLTAIYQETVRQGFRPYYFCEDEDRFAMTFAKRQQTPLRLAKMPADRRMVGLSYPGGMSRNTTAILCYFQEEPVIVFIDRVDFDNKSIAKDNAEQNLRVHRSRLGDLVIYEVSSQDQAMFTDFIRLR